MNSLERFYQLQVNAISDEFTDVFRPPTCPKVEERWEKLLENLPDSKYGSYTNGLYILAEVKKQVVFGIQKWIPDQPEIQDVIIIEKNPNFIPVLFSSVGSRNALCMVENTILVAKYDSERNMYRVIRPILKHKQKILRDLLSPILQNSQDDFSLFYMHVHMK